MTIYWERCDWCGTYIGVKRCYLQPSDNICPTCCILCRKRSECPNPAWSPWLKTAKPKKTNIRIKSKI